MANPILTSDLYKNTGELKELIKELEAVQERLTDLRDKEVKDAATLEASVKKLVVTRAQDREEIEKAAKQTDELQKRLLKYNESLGDNAIKLAGVKNAQSDINRLNKLEAKLLASKEGSYNQLSAQYSINKIRLNQLSTEERKATKEGQELERTTRDIYEEMKRLQEATGKYTLNVGNYASAIGGASKKQKALVAELKETEAELKTLRETVGSSDDSVAAYEARVADLTEQIDNLGKVTGKTASDYETGFLDSLSETDGVAGKAAQGVKGLGGAFKALLANPVVLVISLIVAGLAALFNAFTRSEKGAQLLSKATGLFNSVMAQLTDLSVAAYEAVEFLFTEPEEAISNLGEIIKENIINRFQSIPLLAKAAGDAIRALWNRDLDALKQAGEDAFTAVAQAVTGLDEEQQDNLVDAVRETTKEIINETNAFIALEERKKAVRRANRDLVRSIEQLSTAEQLNQTIADDSTRSFAEREAAAEKARIALEARAAKEIELARNNLSLLNTEIDLRRANGEEVENLLDQQLGAYQELAAAERELTVATADNEKTRRELVQDRLERDLDILIDGFDNQKTVNERLLQDERKTFEQRAAIFRDTRQLSDDSFAQQIATIQKFTGVQVDANDLIAESDAVALNQKIRSLGLSEIIEGRLLEIIRDRRIANQDLADAEVELATKGRDARLKALTDAQAVERLQFESSKRTAEEIADFNVRQKEEELAEIRRLNEEFDGLIPKVDTAKLEAEVGKIRSAVAKARVETNLELFDQQQALAQSEFDLLEKSEKTKTEFRLEAERDRLRKIIELNEKFGSDLTAAQLATIKNQVAAIDSELSKSQGKVTDIYDAFGLDIPEEKKEALGTAFKFAKQQLFELAAARVEAAKASVAAANKNVEESQRELQIQQQNAAAGLASSVETARRRVEEEKKIRDKAIEEQKKAEKVQRQLQTVQQAGNLVSAAAKIFAQIGNPLIALPIIGLMFASFTAAKIKAGKVAKNQTFGGGGTGVFDYGGSHASGDDIVFGSQNGTTLRAQKGERWSVFSRGATQKYGGLIPDVIRAFNANNFEAMFTRRNDAPEEVKAGPALSVNVDKTDMGRTNNLLEGIKENTGTRESKDSRGRRVVTRGAETTTYL